ncbi:MAG: hypothetical protein LBI40_02250 [Treponema sp.]|nr:hypothetical protein [Treponema sp.]
MIRNPVAIVFLTTLSILSGCSSMGWLDAPNVPAAEDIDYSYPVSGNVAAQGTIMFKFKPKFWEKLLHNPPLPVPAGDSEIIVYFGYVPDFRWTSSWVPAKRKGEMRPFFLLWGDTSKYTGKCDIIFGTSSLEGELVIIRRNPSKPVEKNATITVLNIATTRTVSVEMNNYISTDKVVPSMPPCSWGELILSDKAYRIFSVIEEAYYARYPDFSQEERKKLRGFGSRVETTARNFLRDEQKFQILDNAGAVVAELRKDAYTLYDTLPQAEWDDMKQALALFHAFRYMANRRW